MEPLAERLRPRRLEDYIGQEHLVGEGAVLRRMIDSGRIASFILWGPPGVGKTTLAQIIAQRLETPFFTLSAVTSGVKDVREVIERAQSNRFFNSASPILFIDEIHRFSKSQQDSLLGAVEKGTVTLIGATTENPSFEVIRPLLSRCQLYVLKSLEKADLLKLLHRAVTEDVELKKRHIELRETDAILRYSGGDARKLLNILDLIVAAETGDDANARALNEGAQAAGVLGGDEVGGGQGMTQAICDVSHIADRRGGQRNSAGTQGRRVGGRAGAVVGLRAGRGVTHGLSMVTDLDSPP